MRVLSVVGARPQFIKAAVVSDALRELGIAEFMVHTGQHYSENMSDVFFRELDIRAPDVNLDIRGDTHAEQTGRMLIAVESMIIRERPDRVLVYGDTNSTLAGALAASKLGVPVDHVEAGLRSFNRSMPEEINRVMTDHLADVLFAPSATAVGNLQREGVARERIQLVGDVMYDSVCRNAEKARKSSRILDDLGLRRGAFAIATVHRAENTDDRLRLSQLLKALDALAETVPLLLPAHPRLTKMMDAAGLGFGRARSLPPLGYLDMIELVANARLVLTDSGGLQKEAAFLNVPCVTLRTETEWKELVDLGWNVIAPPGPAMDLIAAAERAFAGQRLPLADAFGDGKAGMKIATIVQGRGARSS